MPTIRKQSKKHAGAKNLLNFRTFLKMDQVEFGKQVGVTQAAISNYENGSRNPSIAIGRKIIKMAKRRKYKMTLDDLYD